MRWLLCALLVIPNLVYGQSYVHWQGWVAPLVRDHWKSEWSEHAGQKERGGCVEKWEVYERVMREGVDTVYLVLSVKPTKLVQATPTATGPLGCKPGQPWYHVHPPHTCGEVDRDCTPDGLIGRWCGPSRDDLLYLLATKAPFALVWCGPREWVFFFPHHIEIQP